MSIGELCCYDMPHVYVYMGESLAETIYQEHDMCESLADTILRINACDILIRYCIYNMTIVWEMSLRYVGDIFVSLYFTIFMAYAMYDIFLRFSIFFWYDIRVILMRYT